jgi:hypothetical protein
MLLAGIQEPGLDTSLRPYDMVDFHRNPLWVLSSAEFDHHPLVTMLAGQGNTRIHYGAKG